MMRKPWVLAAVGLSAFAILVWVAGPLLVIGGQAPLASARTRLLVLAVFILQYLAQKLWARLRGRYANERVVAALQPAAEPGLSTQAAQVRERFSTALAELRSTRFGARGGYWSASSWKFGRSYLYQLPWYMIIGVPAAGKTTALLNSGLRFALAGKAGGAPVGGFGAARHCDWWFTDKAVILDRDIGADDNAWRDLLQLLRRVRPQRPLNGVLLALSVSELLGFDAAQLAARARDVRARLHELQTAFGMRLPVYVLLTKCDLLPGFLDSFGALERGEREREWGVSVDLRATNAEESASGFAPAFNRLIERLVDGLGMRLQAERDPQRRVRILALPRELRALGGPLTDLIGRTFGPSASSADGAAALLRGVYLTSGTQDGTPIDRMLSAFGRDLGLAQQILPSNKDTGKSFFLGRLFSDIVFAEADLDGRKPLFRRRRRVLLAAGIGTIQLCAWAVAAAWIAGWHRSADEIAQLDAAVTRAQALLAGIPTRNDADPRPLLPALDALRDLAGESMPSHAPATVLDIGAGARRKLKSASRNAYDRLLLGGFQARIAGAIDATLRTGSDVNIQYEALKAYAMLKDAAHFDATGFKVFVMSYWNSTLPLANAPAERRALLGHLNALLDAGAVGSGMALDPALIASVRSRLAAQSGALRIALRLWFVFDAHPFADFAVTATHPAAAGLWVSADGKSEPLPVPGLYTIEAYQQLVLTQVPALAAQLAAEAPWVLGKPGEATVEDVAAFMNFYRADYARTWTRLLDDLRLKPAANRAEAVQQLNAITAPDGALAKLLEAIVRETPLGARGATDGPISPADPGAERLTALSGLTTPDTNGVVPLAQTLRSIQQATGDRNAFIVTSAQRELEPVRSILLALASSLERAAVSPEVPAPASASGPTSSRQIAASLGVACLKVVGGRYPFDRAASRDATLEDFSRLFAPRGAFDQVFQQSLAARVDTSTDTWRARGPSAPAATLVEQFRSAARIRDVLFAPSAKRPGFKLTFRPLDMDAEIDRISIDIDGQTVRYAHGPLVPTVVTWPGPRGNARLDAMPSRAGESKEYSGPWALFRLLDHAAVQEAGAPSRFKVVFDVGGRHASFVVDIDRDANPFRLRELEHFECPLPGR